MSLLKVLKKLFTGCCNFIIIGGSIAYFLCYMLLYVLDYDRDSKCKDYERGHFITSELVMYLTATLPIFVISITMFELIKVNKRMECLTSCWILLGCIITIFCFVYVLSFRESTQFDEMDDSKRIEIEKELNCCFTNSNVEEYSKTNDKSVKGIVYSTCPILEDFDSLNPYNSENDNLTDISYSHEENEKQYKYIEVNLPIDNYCCDGKGYSPFFNQYILYFTLPVLIVLIIEFVFITVDLERRYMFFSSILYACFCCYVAVDDDELRQLTDF